MAVTIATLNVNGLRNDQKRDMVFNYLTRKTISIICLQETHSVQTDEDIWCKQWGGGGCNIIFSHGKSNSRGVAILTSFKSGFDIVTHQRDNKGRWVKAEIQMKEKNITVVSVYAPNILTERKIFFKDFEF